MGYCINQTDTNFAMDLSEFQSALKAIKALAPFVKTGSYIGMRGEDGEMWRWAFNHGCYNKLAGHVVYEPVE